MGTKQTAVFPPVIEWAAQRRGLLCMNLKNLLLLLPCCAMMAEGGEPNTTPQQGVNMESYLGRWYEQARYDNYFERGMDNVYTDYSMGKNGSITVMNYGYSADGKQHKAKGVAVTDADKPGEMRVSFVPPYFWFRAPYRILYVNEDYSAALVSGDDDDYLWLLTREKEADVPTLRKLMQEAERRGFDTSKLRQTQQHQNLKSTPADR